MAKFRLARLPQTDDELWEVVHMLWGVTIPRQQVCPDHVPPFLAFADAYFNRNSINPEHGVNSMAFWHGSRGLSGKSFMLSILGLTKALLLGSDVNLLGGSLAQSLNIHEHMRNAMDSQHFDKELLIDASNTLVRLANKARIRPLTASQKTVRGPHPPFLLLDEIDEMDQKILDGALGQPMEQTNYLGDKVQPYTVMCSTWQNPEGTFTEMRKRAEEKNWPMYTWCYRESANPVDGWLSERAIAEKKSVISTEMWRVEYELGEPSIGNRAFDSECVRKAFSLPFEPTWADEEETVQTGGYLFKKIAKDYEEYVFEEPIGDALYVAGADWAKEQDYTVIAVGRVDQRPFKLVYFLRLNRRPYPTMVGLFNKAIQKYGAYAKHDGTGLGNVVNDYLDERAKSFIMSGEKRDKMLSEYVSAVENGEWAFPKIPIAFTKHLYAQYGDLYSRASTQYHLPDEVCAFGLMHHEARRFAPKVMGISVDKDPTPNKYAALFTPYQEVDPSNDPSRAAGEVRQYSEDRDEFSFSV